MHCLANDKCKRCNVTFNTRRSATASCSAAACSLVRHYSPPAPWPLVVWRRRGHCWQLRQLAPPRHRDDRALDRRQQRRPRREPQPQPTQRSGLRLHAVGSCGWKSIVRGRGRGGNCSTDVPEIKRVQTGAHTASCFFVSLHKPIQTGLKCWRKKPTIKRSACACLPLQAAQRGNEGDDEA